MTLPLPAKFLFVGYSGRIIALDDTGGGLNDHLSNNVRSFAA